MYSRMKCPTCNKEMQEKDRKYICWDCGKMIFKGLTVGEMMKDTSVIDPHKD